VVYYDSQIIANHVVYAALSNQIISFLKKSTWFPLLTAQTTKLNRLAAIFFATISAIGISYTYSYTPDGVLNLAISGLTFSAVWNAAKTWIFSYAIQQGGYHMTKTNGVEK